MQKQSFANACIQPLRLSVIHQESCGMRIRGLPTPLFPVITHAAPGHLMNGNLHSVYRETLKQLELKQKVA